MLSTRAYAAMESCASLIPWQINRRELNHNDVLIQIHYCGICHSDLHQVKDEWKNGTFPMVPGHEIVGVVKSVGGKVNKFKVNDRVGVGCMVNSCGDCIYCVAGDEQFCVDGASFTYNSTEFGEPTYGGYSTHIVVNENFVLQIPDNLNLEAAAPLLCAGITTYSPLKQHKAGHGKHVAVAGLGGLGHMAVKLAKAMGATVTVLSRGESKRQSALNLGADNYLSTSDAKTFEAGELFDIMIDTISAPHDFTAYINLLKLDGVMSLVGAPPEPSLIDTTRLVMRRKSLTGSLIGGIKSTQEMLDFCGKHNIVSDIELIKIDYVNKAYERMLASDVKYRFVIDCSSI